MYSTDGHIDKKRASLELMSKSELTNWRAKIWFNRPAYGKYEGRRDEDAESNTDVPERIRRFCEMVKNFTDDQIWVALRNIPAEKLWQDLYARFNEQAEMVEQMKKIARI